MRYTLAADAVMAIHFLFIAFALTGSFLILWKRWILWLHIPALAWGVWIEASGNVCPLTPLENHYRDLAGKLPTAKVSSLTISARSSTPWASRAAHSS